MRDMPRDDGRLGLRNIILAIAAGVLSAAAIMVFGVPGLDPSLWDETAVVSGLRPPRTIFPGFWRFLTAWLFPVLGFEASIAVLRWLGALIGGCCVAVFCLNVRQILALLIHTSRTYAVWYRVIAPLFSFVAALLFGVSDPLWRISRVFSPDLFRLAICLLVIHWLLRWFTVGGQWRLFPAFALMGAMAAETPFAFIMPVLFVAAYAAVWHCVVDGLIQKPERLPEPGQMPKWRMFFLFLGALAFSIWLNTAGFVFFGGLEANGWSGNDIYFRYIGGYWHVLADAASLIGWSLGLGMCLIPLIVALCMFSKSVRDDQPMPFNFGVMLFFVGALAAMQTGAFPAARFWTYSTDEVLVGSGFLLAFFAACAMTSFGLVGAGFAFECQRKYLTGGLDDEVFAWEKPGRLVKGVVPVLACCVAVLALLHVRKPVETEMQRIVDDAVAETVEECEGVRWLFTDGRLDAGLELAAAARGRELTTLDMMSGATTWEESIRTRGFAPGSDDYEAAAKGVPGLLRIWAGERTNGMDRAAIQLGFEFWKRERRPLPKASGLVARETGFADGDVERGIGHAKDLSRRILEIAPKVESADPSPALASAFSAVTWRLSRFARLREDRELADELDLSNGALKKMLSVIEYERMRTFMQLTPREGLQLALRRADFAEARRYSMAVLHNDVDDPEANFAVGMHALVSKNFQEAETYLKRCLKRRPNEPAVLNNLSIIFRKQRRWKEAEDFARKAMEILPGSPEVRQTLSDALKKAP